MPAGKPLKVAVIGAGYSGLAAARELLREGHRVILFEKNNHIGGTWLYDPRTESDPLCTDPNREIVHGSTYLSMRTNTPRQFMGFLDYPFEKHQDGDPRTFPGHEEVLRFLERFVEDFGIWDVTRLETAVVRVERTEDGWEVESRTRGSGLLTREIFGAVVVCSGHYSQPKLSEPKIPGIDNWPGYQMHSHNYRIPDPFKDMVVVIIGYGPSGFDISKDIAAVAKEVHISIRINQKFIKKIRNIEVKVNKDLLRDFDNIRHHSAIKCVYEDGTVAFEDGFSVHADAIIHCTGYKDHIPFLETKGTVRVEDKGVGPLYKHVFPPSLAPSLSFIGFTRSLASVIIIELQSKWLAKVLSGKLELPSEEEMMNCAKKYYSKGYSSILGPFEVEYENWLVEQNGLPAMEEWRELMLTECCKKVLEMEHNYKDQWDDAYWDAIINNHI